MKTNLPVVKEVLNMKDVIKKMDTEGNIVGYLFIEFEIMTSDKERVNLRHDVINQLNYVNRDKGFTFKAI